MKSTVDTHYLEVGFLEFPDISKWNLSPKLSCSYFHINTNFYVKMSNLSTSLISNFLRTYSVFKVRHILFNQPNNSPLWASPAKLTPLTHVRTLNVAYCMWIVLKRCEYLCQCPIIGLPKKFAPAMKNTHLSHPFPWKSTSGFIFQMFMSHFAYSKLTSTAQMIWNIECRL